MRYGNCSNRPSTRVDEKGKGGYENRVSGSGKTERVLPAFAYRYSRKDTARYTFEEDELDQTLRNLEIDEYFDVIRSDKKGELVYCINMQKKGLQFARVEHAFKSNLALKIMLTLGLSVVTALIGVGIRYLVGKLIGG